MTKPTQIEADFKPCPFCGSTDIDPKGWASQIACGPQCQSCGATAETLAQWNTRTAAAQVGGQHSVDFLEGIAEGKASTIKLCKQVIDDVATRYPDERAKKVFAICVAALDKLKDET